MRVKICGINSIEDAKMVENWNPDYMGYVVDYPSSLRSIKFLDAIKILYEVKIPAVFLHINSNLEVFQQPEYNRQVFAVQLHGDETDQYVKQVVDLLPNCEVWKAIHLPVNELNLTKEFIEKLQGYANAGCKKIILDSKVDGQRGGTGVTCNWTLAKQVVNASPLPIILAGGLNFQNVSSAINAVKPYGVDVSSGVEVIKGKKDLLLVKNFIENARLSF